MKIGELCRRNAMVADARMKLHEAAELMRRTQIADLPVVDVTGGGARLLGILRVADLVASTAVEDLGWVGSLLVSDVMTTNIELLWEDGRALDLLQWFRRHGIYRAPVCNNRGMFVGVVAFDDVIERLTSELVGLIRPAGDTLVIDLEDGLPAYTD